jgi:hypothetical protein
MDFRHIVYGFGTSNVETSVHEIWGYVGSTYQDYNLPRYNTV